MDDIRAIALLSFSNLSKEQSHFPTPNLIKNSEVIMSSQNILQQIKNSHSLLPASRDPPPSPYAIALTQKFNKQKQARYF
ncbi:MAG: hypothetical protein ACM65L_21015 [Microcoleus sp.]